MNADWNSASGLNQILNKPTLFGLSSLLAGLGVGSNTNIAAADTLIQALEKLQAQITGLAAVARSGSYTDLINKPTIISIQQLTKVQYDALTTAQKNNASILYVIVG